MTDSILAADPRVPTTEQSIRFIHDNARGHTETAIEKRSYRTKAACRVCRPARRVALLPPRRSPGPVHTFEKVRA
jgi:hypothetical protein